jgi:hypothetical protein
MAFTDEEESKLRTIISAFDEGQQVDDLPLSDTTVQDKEIEVYDAKNGNSERMSLEDAVKSVNAPYFGRVFNNANATPLAATWVGSLAFGRTLADQLGLGCYLVQNDHTRRKLDPNNHYRFANGETAKLDGSMGHYMWGWSKPFYIAFQTVGGLFQELVSLSPIPGCYNYKIPVGSMSASGFGTIDRTSGALVSYLNDDPQYRGGDNKSDYDDTYRTLCGKAATSMTAEAFRAAARKNGAGWLSGTMRHSTVVKVLFEVIFGTRNVQAAYNSSKDSDGLYQGGLGTGVTTIASATWNTLNGYRPFLPMSAGVELGDSCGISNYEVTGEDGSTVYTAPIPVFFGLKNLHGYLWRQQDDEFARVNEDTSVTHLVAPSIYGEWTTGDETGMLALSTSPTKCSSYIKTVSYDNLENFPTQVGGSETTYHCDYFWNNSGVTSGFRLVRRGCTADSGSYSGLSDVSVSFAVSYANVDIGAPLCEAEDEWSVEPVYAEAA